MNPSAAPAVSQDTQTLINPKAPPAELEKGLRRFAVDPAEMAAVEHSMNVRIGGWEFAVAQNCYENSKAYQANSRAIEHAILKKFPDAEATLAAVLASAENRGHSAMAEAYQHYDFVRHGDEPAAPVVAAPYKASVQRVQSAVGRVKALSGGEINDTLTVLMEAVSAAQTAKLLADLGVDPEQRFQKSSHTLKNVILTPGGGTKTGDDVLEFMHPRDQLVKEIAAYASKHHGLTLDRWELGMAISRSRTADLAALDQTAAKLTAELRATAQAVAELHESVQSLGPLSADRDSLRVIAYLRQNLPRVPDAASKEAGDFFAASEFLRNGPEMAQLGQDIRTRSEAMAAALRTEQTRILEACAREAIMGLFQGETSDRPGALQAVLKSAVRLAGEKVGDYHGSLFEFVRTEILQPLAKDGGIPWRAASPRASKIVQALKVSKDDPFSCPAFDAEATDFWGAVGLHAVSMAVGNAVHAELHQIRESQKIAARAGSVPKADTL